jgi:hypothetical protein
MDVQRLGTLFLSVGPIQVVKHYGSLALNQEISLRGKKFGSQTQFVSSVQHVASTSTPGNKSKIFVDIIVNGHRMSFLLDTGATRSMIDLEGYNALGAPVCKSTNMRLVAYGDTSGLLQIHTSSSVPQVSL